MMSVLAVRRGACRVTSISLSALYIYSEIVFEITSHAIWLKSQYLEL